MIKSLAVGANPPQLIGRADDSGPVTLKLNGGVIDFRDADGGGFVPIGSFAEFQLIRTRLDPSYATDRYKQEADLDLLGDLNNNGIFGEIDDYEEWTAIGINSNPSRFFGTFDGADKGIRNIYINKPGVSCQGLFGFAGAGSTISNVHILSGKVTGTGVVGGVAGYLGGGSSRMTGCFNSGTVEGATRVGGVVGYSPTATSTIRGCFNSGTTTETVV